MTLYTLSLSQCWPDITGCDVLHVSFSRRRGRSRSTEEVVGYFWQIDGGYQGFLWVGRDFVVCPAGNQDAMTAFLERERSSDGIAHALVRNDTSLAELNYVYHNQAWPLGN